MRTTERIYSKGSDYDREKLAEAASDYESVEVLEHEELEVVKLFGQASSIDALLSESRELDSGKGTLRTMLGKQYLEEEDLPDVNGGSYGSAPARVAADGGKEETGEEETLAEIDHEGIHKDLFEDGRIF